MSLDVSTSAVADRFLRLTGKIWYAVAATGQLAFIYFIVVYYGTRTLAGNYPAWNDRNIINGYIAGDRAGNIMFALHVLLAIIMIAGGLLQLLPAIRRRAPGFHRWTGRVFILLAYFMAIGGLWLVWVRGTRLSLISGIAISVDAVLILICASLALYFAIRRRIDIHRRWAMRTFMVASAVWFLRVGLMAWIILNQGPRGMDGRFSGPADILLMFGCYLIPLGVLELYFRAQDTKGAGLKWASGTVVLIATGITAIGVFGTVRLMWGPYL